MEASFSASIQQLCFIVYVAYKRGKALRNSSDPTDDDEHAKYELRRISLLGTWVNKARGRADPLRADPSSSYPIGGRSPHIALCVR